MNASLTKLNPEQLRAATHTEGPLLIVAGAGTGKTTVLVNRLAFLIEKGLAKQEEILLITFTRKGAEEIDERADKLLPYGYVDRWISTFHDFCARILREHALDIGLPGDFKVITQTEAWVIVKKHLDEFNLDYYRPLGNPTKFIHELLKHFSRLKDEDIGPSEYLEYASGLEQDSDAMMSGGKGSKVKSKVKGARAAKAEKALGKALTETADNDMDGMEASRIIELANAYHAYNKLLLDNSYLDFGDLICYTLKLFRERPNILKIYQEKFKYIMVDEFQDTNWAQYEMIKILVGEKKNLVVVGDDDQAIYKFRGASLSNIMQFKDDFPKAKEVILNLNYRSGQAILDKAYEFIKHNDPNRLEVKLKIGKDLRAQKKEPGNVEHLYFMNDEDETRAVIEKILSLKREDKEASWADFAILTRANDTANKFIAELKRNDIPGDFLSQKGLYFKPAILDIVSYFRLLDNYHESSALFRVLNIPAFRLSHADIIAVNFFVRAKGWSMYEGIANIAAVPKVSPEGVANAAKLTAMIARHSVLARREKPSRIFLQFINESGLIRDYDFDRDKEIFNQISQFYKRIIFYEDNDPDLRLRDFMELLNLEMESGESGSLNAQADDADTVKVMTVHAAKGKEYKFVFIVNVADKKFPTIGRGEKIPVPDALVREKLPETGDEHLEEERRLFYVAMTRAKEKLFFTSAEDYGGVRKKKISRFLFEAGVAKEGAKPMYAEIQVKGAKSPGDMFLPEKEKAPACQDKYYLPSKFSFSQVETYNNCPLQYKFNYILKIPTPGKAVFVYGRVMHSVLRDFLSPLMEAGGIQPGLFGAAKGKGGKAAYPDFKKLLDIFAARWEDDGYDDQKQREGYKKKARKSLEIFYADLEENGWPEPLYLEKNFAMRLGEFMFRGAIDRVDRLSDGTAMIIDYKTGQPKDKLAFEEKRQLILYQLALEDLFKIKVSKLAYYYLDSGKKIAFSATEKDVEKFEEQALASIERIRSCDFTPTPGFVCDWCDFNGICEFRKINNR
ncbi:MAG: ATP-dependent DNA helicase [Patescibacteria group bacterium]|jgi:DNA helicase-2/ATP-dependent DNA helicase PcrA